MLLLIDGMMMLNVCSKYVRGLYIELLFANLKSKNLFTCIKITSDLGIHQNKEMCSHLKKPQLSSPPLSHFLEHFWGSSKYATGNVFLNSFFAISVISSHSNNLYFIRRYFERPNVKDQAFKRPNLLLSYVAYNECYDLSTIKIYSVVNE